MTSANLACCSSQSKQGLSSSAHKGSGTTDLIIVHKVSCLNYLRYLLRTATYYKHPFDLSFVEAVTVQSWDFTPQVNLGFELLPKVF